MATREPKVGREGPLLSECLLKDSSQSQRKAQVGSALPSAAIRCWGSLAGRQATYCTSACLPEAHGWQGWAALLSYVRSRLSLCECFRK